MSYTDQLLVDTGSANTWVGARKKYVRTSTSINLNQRLRVLYGMGLMRGNEYSDTVTFGDNYHISVLLLKALTLKVLTVSLVSDLSP